MKSAEVAMLAATDGRERAWERSRRTSLICFPQLSQPEA